MKLVIGVAVIVSLWAGVAISAGSVSVDATAKAYKHRLHAIEEATDAAR